MKLQVLQNIDFDSEELIGDVFIFFDCVESRSNYILKNLAFKCEHQLKISEADLADPEGSGGFSSSLKDFFSGIENKLTVVVDISCMPRLVISEVLTVATQFGGGQVEFLALYSLAKFTPPTDNPVINEAIEPVHKNFAGWSTPDTKPTSLVLGLGYEVDRAEGASEFFEPSEQWVFIPQSPVYEFFQIVEKNNKRLIEEARHGKLIEYNVLDPALTFGQLEMVVALLVERTNPILLPFGPKIFFFLCLVQCFNHPELGVWHFSNRDNYTVLQDVAASGEMAGVRCVFG